MTNIKGDNNIYTQQQMGKKTFKKNHYIFAYSIK